mmetsp:Transcript_36550/g.112605  ORF Transcript_36550/g.112605 Transcript_36550/m.112605 type:complete len:1041 (-) Transcript_36550:10-3132(-)
MRFRCTYCLGLVALLFFVFGVAPFAAFAFYESTKHTVLNLRTPPESTMVGETVALLQPHFNTQLSHHPLYYAAFSRNDNVIWFLAEMEAFFYAFDAAVKASFIGPHVTIIQSNWNIPSAGQHNVLSPDWRTTLIKLDNNMSALDQTHVIQWMRDFASNYAASHANFSAQCEVDVTGVGAMTESLRDTVWIDMIIVAAVGIVLSSLMVPLPLLLEKWAVLRGVRTPGADALVQLVFATSRRSEDSRASGACLSFPLYFFSRRRILLGGSLLTFFGTLSMCFTALASMWVTVRATPTSSLAPILGFLILCPLTAIFMSASLDTAVFTILRRRVEAEVADQDRKKSRCTAKKGQCDAPPIHGRASTSYGVVREDRGDLNASLLPATNEDGETSDAHSTRASSINNNDSPDPPGEDESDSGNYAFGFDGEQLSRTLFEEDRSVYAEARGAVTPWLVVTYTAALLLCGGLWLVHVEAVSSAGCGAFFAIALHGPLFFFWVPHAMACAFPSCAMQEFHARVESSSDDSAEVPLLVRSICRGASSLSLVDDDHEPLPEVETLPRKVARIVAQWVLKPPVLACAADRRVTSQRDRIVNVAVTVFRCSLVAGLVAIAVLAIYSAEGNVAFFREVPRNAPVVINGHRLLNGIGAATAGPYNLVFKTHEEGGLLADPDAFTNSNIALFEAVDALGFDMDKVTSITHASFLGFPINISLSDAQLLLLLKNTIGNSYAYLWRISVDSTATYFQLTMYPNFDPFGQGQPVATQEKLGTLVEGFRKRFGGTFEFIGWYGANAPTWAAMITALPRLWKWTGIAMSLLFGFVATVWLRWGALDAPSSRLRAVSRPNRHDPLAPVPSAASTCTRLAVWRIGRAVALGAGYSLGVLFPVTLSVALGFALAIWMFQYGGAFRWVWPILADVEGVSWLVVPILVPAAASTAFAVELMEWLSLHNEHQRSEQLRARRRHASQRVGQEADVFESNISPRSKLAVRISAGMWIIAFLTLGFSKTIMINEVGVVLSSTIFFQLVVVGPLLRNPFAVLLDLLRRRL